MGQEISLIGAEKLLRQDLQMIEQDISGQLERQVTHNEFSAMVCLAYNVGTGAFADSTVLHETNAGNRRAAADGFLLWNKANVNGEYRVLPHLDQKRREERALYLKG